MRVSGIRWAGISGVGSVRINGSKWGKCSGAGGMGSIESGGRERVTVGVRDEKERFE